MALVLFMRVYPAKEWDEHHATVLKSLCMLVSATLWVVLYNLYGCVIILPATFMVANLSVLLRFSDDWQSLNQIVSSSNYTIADAKSQAQQIAHDIINFLYNGFIY